MREYYDLLRTTSRTFAVGIESLPRPLRDSVTLAYLVLRVSDYFEDSPSLPSAEKRRLLEGWARLLEDSGAEAATHRPKADPGKHDGAAGSAAFEEGAGSESLDAGAASEALDPGSIAGAVSPSDAALPDYRAALHAEGILNEVAALPPASRQIIRRHTAATTRGMAHWIGRGDDFPDEAALDAYMFEVAGRVGLLLTDLFVAEKPRLEARRPDLEAVAVAFGLGLQTVNVIRGLHEDPVRGWTYVPRDVLGTDSGSGDLRGLSTVAKERVLGFLVRKAARHVADGFRYCQALPRTARGIRIFCIVPALIASRTVEASRRDLEVFDAPVKVSRGDVRRIILETRLRFFSNRWLEGERRRILALATEPGVGSARAERRPFLAEAAGTSRPQPPPSR
jgi:farnesyl-diphosphate farnesyltransferase